MNLKTEKEFFRLAAWFLIARGSLLKGECIIKGYRHDDCGAYIGMVDNAREMRLIVNQVLRPTCQARPLPHS